MFSTENNADKFIMRKVLTAFLSVFPLLYLSAQTGSESLLIRGEDLRLSYEEGGDFNSLQGFHLYIRKKPGIESVMLVETTKDPGGKNANYSYRALEYNRINGDEKRILDGKFLETEHSRFSLIDSTPEKDSEFGQAFHIYIPSEIQYGYPWTRNGKIKIEKGTFINIRSFAKKYCDYSGAFNDNPFMFDLGSPVRKVPAAKNEVPAVPQTETDELPEVKEVPVLTDDYNPEAAETFKDIASFNGGKMVYSKGPETLISDITESLSRIDPKETADVIFAVDATGSMKDDVQKLRDEWIPVLIESMKEFKDIRLGLLLYRDYGDTYRYMGLPVKKFDFTNKIEQFTKNLNSFVIYGSEGGDIPEAVYEALYGSMDYYAWRTKAYRKIILIGDAQPHPEPRGTGKYTRELVERTAKAKGVVIDAIIVPDDKSERGR